MTNTGMTRLGIRSNTWLDDGIVFRVNNDTLELVSISEVMLLSISQTLLSRAQSAGTTDLSVCGLLIFSRRLSPVPVCSLSIRNLLGRCRWRFLRQRRS